VSRSTRVAARAGHHLLTGDGALRSISSRPSRGSRPVRGGRAQSPALGLALVRLASPSEVRGVVRVAGWWLDPRPPRRSERPRGLPRSTGLPRRWNPGRASRGVRFLFRAESRLGCPGLGPAPSTCVGRSGLVRLGKSPLLGFLLPRARLRRVPRVAPSRACARGGEGGGRQASTGAVLGVLAPLDGSGCARGESRAPAGARLSPWRPDASRPCFVPLAPLGVSLQSFPFPRSRTRSRGPRASLRVRVRPPNGAAGPRCSRPVSPIAPTSRRSSPRRARRTGRPGRRFPGVARRRAGRLRVPLGVSSRIGRARRTRQPTRPLRSFAPPGSPFAFRSRPWPGRGRTAGALLGFGPLEIARTNRGCGVARERPSSGEPNAGRPRVLGSWPRVIARSRSSGRGV